MLNQKINKLTNEKMSVGNLSQRQKTTITEYEIYLKQEKENNKKLTEELIAVKANYESVVFYI